MEVVRTDGLSYSVFNLEAQFHLATIAKPVGIDLWNHVGDDGASLRRGLEYLVPYNQDPVAWPHRQNKGLEPGFLDHLIERAVEVWPDFAAYLNRQAIKPAGESSHK